MIAVVVAVAVAVEVVVVCRSCGGDVYNVYATGA